jgi:hypothetical protein
MKRAITASNRSISPLADYSNIVGQSGNVLKSAVPVRDIFT